MRYYLVVVVMQLRFKLGMFTWTASQNRSFSIGSESISSRPSPKNFSNQTLTNFSRNQVNPSESGEEFIFRCSVGQTVGIRDFPIGSEGILLWLLQKKISDRISIDFLSESDKTIGVDCQKHCSYIFYYFFPQNIKETILIENFTL